MMLAWACATATLGQTADQSLLVAAGKGDAVQVREALQRGANANYFELFARVRWPASYSPLIDAVNAKSVDAVKPLLEAGADPLWTHPNYPMQFALAAACRLPSTNRQIVELLLNATPRLPANEDRIVDWVVYPVAFHGDEDLLNRLENKGADLARISELGSTSFMAAAEGGHYELGEKLLAKYGSQYAHATNRVNIRIALIRVGQYPYEDSQLAQLLHRATKTGLSFTNTGLEEIWRNAAALHLPLTAEALGCPPEELKKIEPRSILSLLTIAGDREPFQRFTNLFAQLLISDAEPKMLAKRLFANLAASSAKPDLPKLKFLLSQGADPNFKLNDEPWQNDAPMFVAIWHHDLSLIEFLSGVGVDINAIDPDTKLTALDWAASRGETNTLQWLLEHGARLQERTTGHSLLSEAIQSPEHGQILAMVEILRKGGADPYVQHEQKKAAVDILAEQHQFQLLKELDTNHVYKELLEKYTPPTNSPFVGAWSNGKDGFEAFGLVFQEDGLAIIATPIFPIGPFSWLTVSNNQADIEFTDNGQRQDVVAEWLPQDQAIRLVISNQTGPDLLRKVPQVKSGPSANGR